jgi:periplasmic protein TonB
MDNKSWLKSTIDDLVFANRNKTYGAFSLRRLYDKHMSRGMIAGMLGFLLLIFTPYIYARIQEWTADQNEDLSMKEVTLAEPPPIDPKKPPPPPPPKVEPPPVKAQIKFVPPKVQKDEEVKDEEPPPKVEEIQKAIIASETVKGEESSGNEESKAVPDAPPPPPPPVVEEKDPDEDKVFEFVQQKPQFPDGDKALLKYLSENMKYPPIARENGIEGRVIVKFQVSKTGEISNAQVVRGIGGGCDEEALRVVRSMPRWSPGKNNGKPVNVNFTLPVTFKLQG